MSTVTSSPKVVPYFVHRRSTSQSSDDFGAEGMGTPGYLVSTPSESRLGVYGSEDEVVDMLPPGASADEFGPRTVMVRVVELGS